MRLLYEPSNAIEAHMILNLLEQSGLSGRIDGEFLQGGVGDLQAAGFIRVMIEEADYPAANEIVKQWDTHQPREFSAEPPQRLHPFFSGFIGFCAGLMVLTIYYHTSTTYDGLDYDGDGVLDETWVYVRDRIKRTEVDRDLDGKVDHITQFNRVGHPISARSDDNFDGFFETELVYFMGNVESSKSDTTGDGRKNYQIFFRNDVIRSVKFIDPVSGKPIKIQTYDGIKLKSAKLDTNGDGQLDTSYSYDHLEEINKVNVLKKHQ